MPPEARAKAKAKRAARKVESTRWFRMLSRGGYVANGLVHVIVGAVVLVLAFGGDGEADHVGAFRALGWTPVGWAALWFVAVSLCALGAWHTAEGVLTGAPDDDAVGSAKKWGARIGEFGQALVFLVLGGIAVAIALGARPDANETAEQASRGILAVPGGPLVLALVGVGIGVTGVAFIVMGLARSFEKRMDLPPGGGGHAIAVLGVVGFVAKGTALIILGVLLIAAAIRMDPAVAGTLDEAMNAVLELPFGPALATAVGAGLVVYGVFCGFRARYARMEES
jgi:hypothetical protein